MSESVEILIKADDQASAKLQAVSANADKAAKQVTANFKEMGGNAKRTSDFIGVLASLTGNSEIAGFAGQMAAATEKVSAFSDVAKEGGAGAMAFRLGLMGLAATIGAGIGKAIGDIVFETKKWERSMKNAADEAASLDAQLKKVQATIFSNATADIELIRDPDAKKAAYKDLLEKTNNEIQALSGNVEKGKREVEAWAKAWQITGERKALAVMAQEQLDADRARLLELKGQRDEITKIVSVRAAENEQIRKTNEAKDKSASFIDGLRQEITYLKASREEQIKIEAIRSATPDQQRLAANLLRQRDAIIAQKQAIEEKLKLEQQARDEAQKAAEKAEQDAQREIERVENLVAAEQQRLGLQRMELEYGKEAAKAQELMLKGVDVLTAKQIAAEETAVEALRKKKQEEAKLLEEKEKKDKKGPSDATLQASQSRLLTRGSGSSMMDATNRILDAVQKQMAIVAGNGAAQLEAQRTIARNTASSVTVRPVT